MLPQVWLNMRLSGCGPGPDGSIGGGLDLFGSEIMAGGTKPPVEGNGNGIKRLGEKLSKASKRSPFSVWMAANFERFADQIAQHGARWDVIARWAQDENLTGGKPITAANTKRIYEREKARRAKAAAVREGRSKREAPASTAPVSTAPVRMLPQRPAPEQPQVPTDPPADPAAVDEIFGEDRPWIPRGRQKKEATKK
jgi:hypothetical protein